VRQHLRVEAIDVTRNGRPVLRGVSATFGRGVFNVIVGPSGAGKTSLLRCLNGLDHPEDGCIYLGNDDVRTIAPMELRRRVGMIFQVPVVLPGSVRDNLLYGFEADDDAMERALSQAGLGTDLIDRPADQLSTGQAQRVCIARALIRSPEVLLMDEPTSALDRNAAKRVEDAIETLTASGLTMIFVTHDLEQAQRLGSTALLLVDGCVRYEGAVDRLEEVWKEHSS
jgi:ABC-type phosphate transport system ATPase subunit